MSKEEKYQIRLQQEIDNRASFMNTTKWKILFSTMKDLNSSYVAKVKLLLNENVRELTLPIPQYHSNSKYIEEYWGVFELKEIEWIFIPVEIKSERKNRTELLASKIGIQDIQSLEKQLQTGKQFEYERSELGLKIYGYK